MKDLKGQAKSVPFISWAMEVINKPVKEIKHMWQIRKETRTTNLSKKYKIWFLVAWVL